MKDIVIIANFVAALDGGANSRFTYLAERLTSENNVELVTSDFSHGNKKPRTIDFSRFPYKVTLLYEPGYSKNVCLQRFRSHKIWGNNVKAYLANRKKPDVIYCAVPSLTAASYAADYCNVNNIKFIIDIQDLWPEAFQMVFNIPVISTIVFGPFNRLANKIYSSADEIVAVSKTYAKRASSVSKKCKVGHTVFLGTQLTTFDANKMLNPAIEKYNDEFWIGYCGSLSASYDIPLVIHAINNLSKLGTYNIRFVVMGDGDRKEEFMRIAKEMKVNCSFTGRLPYEIMCATLNQCDIVINPILGGSAASIINKHADYAASGKPLLNTQDSVEYRELVDKYDMGYNCVNGNIEDLTEKLKMLLDNASRREIMGINARRCAEEKFDRTYTYQELVDIIIN